MIFKLIKIYIIVSVLFFSIYYTWADKICNKYSADNVFDHQEWLFQSAKCVDSFICKIEDANYRWNIMNSWECNKKDIIWLEKIYNNYYGEN